MPEKKVAALSFTEGRVVRDLFENGFFQMMNEKGWELVLFTPAEKIPHFKNKWISDVKAIEYLPLYSISKRENRLLRIREKIRTKISILLPFWLQLEKKLYISDSRYEELLKKHNCSLAILTHPTHSFELPLYKAALKCSIPTIGILRSWDNLHKGLRIRPDHLTVWNPVNQLEAITLMKLRPENVHILGGSQFDGYFSDRVNNSSRSSFCETYKLNPHSPILMLATLGAFLHLYDEQYLVDFLIESILDGSLPRNTQLVIRLHPTSRLEYMLKYLKYDFVRLSYIQEYIPSIGWTMTRNEVEDIGCLMKHSDVVISPGSTITIETAIFDTPTIVPVFHNYQPDSGTQIFKYHFHTHFKKLQDENLVPFAETKAYLIAEIHRCLAGRSYYQKQRKKLADDYIYFFDGKSTQRIVDFVTSFTGN